MNLHIVGGFLGSGKTTAIIHAARALMARGQRVGVITNDQGKYLVDTAFFRLDDIPAVEVTGGCFCCNYDDLDARLAQLIDSARPDVIFAESVGSCADVVATVVRPLLELGQAGSAGLTGVKPASFSVFTDARMLRRRLLGLDLPFSEDVLYIFDKQIEEAGLLVVNKIDLLAQAALAEIDALAPNRFPGKPILYQTSLTGEGVRGWLEQIQSGGLALPGAPLEIDYARYGAGEARLAWLDAAVTLHVPPGQGQEAARRVIAGLVDAFRARGAGIGHFKCMVQGVKISIPTLEEPGWESRIPEIAGEAVELLVNARVELPAEELKGIFHAVLGQTGLAHQVTRESAFHPGQPKPSHRMRP